MKFVLFSDLHLDAAFAWAGTDAATKRREALRTTLRRILDLAWTERADAVLCAGDLYEHDRISPDTAGFLRASFERAYPLRIFIAPGNHDWCGPESIYERLQWSRNVRIFKSNKLEAVALDHGITLWGAAHTSPAGTGGFLTGFKVDRGGVNLGLLHGSELGSLPAQGEGKSPHAPFHTGEIETAGLDHVFAGHYHKPRDDERLTYPGNPDPLSFGENGNRGAVVITVSPDGSVKRERRRVGVTEAHDLTVNITGATSRTDVRTRIEAAVQGFRGVARITLEGELSHDVDIGPSHLKDLSTTLDGYVTRFGDIRPPYDFDNIAKEPTVRGQFVKDVIAAALPDEETRRVLITGLRALEGRDDLEVF